MASVLMLPESSTPPTQETMTSICDLDEIVLTHILARLHNPLLLAVTCKTLLHALNSHPCKQEWFTRWIGVLHSIQQPVALTVLGWKPVGHYSIAQLGKFLITAIEQSNPALRKQYQQQLLKTPDLMRREQWVQLLHLFVPWPEHLLLVATAASCHSDLLAELLSIDLSDTTHVSCASSDSSITRSSTESSSISGSPAVRSSRTSSTEPQQRKENGLQQPLPSTLRLRNMHHDLLSSALLAAAAAGQQHCTYLLLQQVEMLQPSPKLMDLLFCALEAAAAAGEAHIVMVVMEELSSISDQYRRPGSYLWQQRGERERQQWLRPSPDSKNLPPGVAGFLHVSDLQEVCTLYAHSSEQPSSSSRAAALAPSDPQQHVALYRANEIIKKMQITFNFLLRAFQQSSSYLLVAAAGSGSRVVASMVLDFMPSHQVKQQLSAALAAAGRAGHLEVFLLLLGREEISSKPLEMAAADAAVRPWPSTTLDALLHYMVQHYRPELLTLLHKPLIRAFQNSSIAAQQEPLTQQNQHLNPDRHQRQRQLRAAAEAMFRVLQAEAVIEFPEMLGDLLLVLAQQGECDKVCWVLKVGPTVLVKLGPAAAAAALEGGHTHVAQVILDAGGERPAAFKAAAKRGELVAAVRSKDLAAVEILLDECLLPLTWTCEAVTAAATTHLPAAAAGAGALHIGAGVQAGPGFPGLQNPAPLGTHGSCLLNLLKTAAAAGAPESVALLRLLLPALPLAGIESPHWNTILAGLIKFCLDLGLVDELNTVYAVLLGSIRFRGRMHRLNLAGVLQLPDDTDYLQHSMDSRVCSMDATSASASAPGPIVAAITVLLHSSSTDVLSMFVVHPYLQLSSPEKYLGVESRPGWPALFMPCKKGLTLLFVELTRLDQLPPSAKVRNTGLYRRMVRIILEACDSGLLHAFLTFMEKHGEALLPGPGAAWDMETEGWW